MLSDTTNGSILSRSLCGFLNVSRDFQEAALLCEYFTGSVPRSAAFFAVDDMAANLCWLKGRRKEKDYLVG